KLIAEKTGYPDDMVEPEMELEEDLGIDTVKQAEMFGIIRTKWDLPREEGVRIQEYSTVNKIADYILDRLKSGTSSHPVSQQLVDADPGGSTFDSMPGRRLSVQLIDAPKINVEKKSLAKKKFVVAGVSNQFTDDLLASLEKRKAKLIKFVDLKKINTPVKIQNELSEVTTDGLIYIEPTTTRSNKHTLSARVLFALCKTIEFAEEPFILTINNSDSAFGFNSKVAPITGSITGFTKALAREFSRGSVKTVSCSNPELAITELCAGDGTVEVAFDKHGTRKVFVSQELPITKIDNPFTPDENDLIVISGGAQGITFEITKKIAENYKPKIALLGRTTLPSNITDISNLDESGLATLKEKMVTDMKLTHEKVTPVMMQKEWSKITKAIAVKKAIEILEQNGSSTRYYSLDVVDKESTSKVIQQISQDFGQEITGLIHGAGLESSKLIANKKFDDFNLVYNVKAIGFDNLVDSLNLKTLKFITCFSSVAGRFGNAGQVDYSAANDYLSKSCWQLRARGIHATSICWSAWAEVGMATRGSVMKVLEYAGVTPLSIDDGVNAFINELENGQDAEVVIAGKLGFLLETPLPFVKVNQKNFPLIGSIKRNFDGSILTERLFSLENDLYLNHHRFDEIPYLPGVMGLELFSELAKLIYPKKTLIRFEDVNFASAVKFKNDQPRTLKARLTYDLESPAISLESDFVKDGVKIGEPRTHFNAKLIFGKKTEKTIPRMKLKSGNLIDNSKLYEILPHGSLFQILKDVNGIDKEIISKTAKPKSKQFAWEIKGFTSKPLAIEAAFQTMGLLDAVKSNKMGLPFGIKTLQFYNSKEDPALVRGTKIAVTEYGSLYNFEVVSKTGQIILDAQGYATVHVDFGVNLTNIDEIRLNRIKRLFNLTAGTILEITDVKGIKTLVENDKNVLTSFLHPDEQVKFSKFTVEKRKYEWLSGVIAIKTALQKLMPDVAFNKIKIEKNELGKPYIKLGSKSKPIHLSITHSNGYAVGIINPTKNTGIDLEVIEKRSASIIDEVLSPKEQDFLKQQQNDLTDELLTKIWTAKEAATKVLGVGLNIDLHDLIVSKLQEIKK
ncbi:MAG: SDR family NAD(P)-dependent oxidoreductase, partial [Candidatus Heimdallarchaeota archaeon]